MAIMIAISIIKKAEMGLINPSEGAPLERSGELGSLFCHRVGVPWRVSLSTPQLTFHTTNLLPGYGLLGRQGAQIISLQKHNKVNYIRGLRSVMERLQTSGINLFGLEFSSMLSGQESLGKLFKYF